MVVHPRNTRLADTAVFTPGRLQKLARIATRSRKVENPVVRIVSHMLRMVMLVDMQLASFLCAQVRK